MRSAQSRLGVVTSLGAARRGVGRCVDALPVPLSAFKVGGAAVAGIAGLTVVRRLFSPRRKQKKNLAATPSAPASHPGAGYLFSEAVLTLLLPLCRRYFLGDPGAAERLFRNGR